MTIIQIIIAGALIAGLAQAPVQPGTLIESAKSLATAEASAAQVIETNPASPVADIFFGEESHTTETKSVIEAKKEFVSTRQAYPASLAVIQRHEKTIREKASQAGVPVDVAIGVGLLENGGSDTAKSPAGALGVFQLMPGTARSLGLTVNSRVDERRDPEKNIEAGMKYLRLNYDRFGDWGLSTWAYHAGEGNVVKALKIYARANHGIELPGLSRADVLRSYVDKNNITINELLSDRSVQAFTKKLKDDSQGYPFKVAATAKLFEEAK